MHFLKRERDVLEELLPGLDAALAATSLMELELPDNPGLKAFKAHGGPGLLVPTEHAGIGADAVAAVRVQRALASRSPSLAVATTMHHFSVATVVETCSGSQGFEWMLLAGIAREALLVASGFAEGTTGQAILSPTMRADVRDGKLIINGSKKPCSLSRSMDLLTASIRLPAEDGSREQLAVALIPAGSPGMHVRPFWNTNILAGAESDEVVLQEVEIPLDLVMRTESAPAEPLDALQTSGFLWFELLMTASYNGVASALVERVLEVGKADAALRADLLIATQAVTCSVEGIAAALSSGRSTEATFVDALVCRYAAQDTIAWIVRRSVEALGGMQFIGSSDIAYLASASAAMAFHPPSRARMAQPLCEYFAGQPLRVP